jgi:glycosyltransferase involved in cell wall biosynthesis
VLNHFAVPRGHPGGTRHVELFGRLPGWSAVIVAGRLNMITGRPQPATPGFVPVPVIPYRRNGVTRVLNWISYALTATVAGLRGPRPDVVYASSPHLLAGLAGWVVARVRRSRFVFEVRDLWPGVLVAMGQIAPSSMVHRLLERLELFLYRRADRIVVLAAGVRSDLERRGVPPERIVDIPNAADPADFAPTAARDVLRRRYGFTRRTAVYAGAHGPANGLDLLLAAAEAVPDLDIALIGSGVEKPRLVVRAADLGLTNVRFLDPVAKAEMPDLLAAADIGLHVLADVGLFRDAVSPNKVFDYLAAGRPVLTNSPGVVGDLIQAIGAGHATQPGRLDEGLRRMAAASDAELDTMGVRGRDWIADHQSRTAMAARLARLLDEVCASPGPAVTVAASC